MESLKIVLLSIAAAVVYGILHDQVTARVCVEYFTIGHPPVFNTESPTLLAFGWGTIATWWVGLMLGLPAVVVARVGRMPKLDASRLVRPIIVLMAVMACASLVAGIAGYFSAEADAVWLIGPLATEVPKEKHSAFLADLWAHLTAYGVGFLGGMALWVWILVKRWQMMMRRGTT